MVWLEIIEIRAVGNNREMLELQLTNLVEELHQNANLMAIKVYRHAVLETDFSIHLFHDSQEVESECSSICIQLVQALKVFGLENHTVWVEKSD